ncbi:glutathione S-transferase family protein [Peredibacter starrii]|uniref:Glutathione S-transferase family protein n=1 Tax=Peredibacter starrii TaxID=28202 RepID=A0AAX4HSB3_9BACT|nr:glutathione S-transferase family protein [Peredibacter starrii]WPU65941.1 glutathione S-transferase family protein [Peredibacter starrii]
MNYTLIGSLTSPFVRRIRMLMETIPYELTELNIYETDDGITLNKINPINQIPVLVMGNEKIWDSRQIFNYLNSKYKFQTMNLEDENTLTAIEGALNAGIALFQFKRSGISIEEPYMIVNRHKDRIDSVLDYLLPFVKAEGKNWNFQTMTLYAFLDWGQFRGILSLEKRPEYQQFMAQHADREIVKKTAIPKV